MKDQHFIFARMLMRTFTKKFVSNWGRSSANKIDKSRGYVILHF